MEEKRKKGKQAEMCKYTDAVRDKEKRRESDSKGRDGTRQQECERPR